jgi:hypothetical protein
MTTDERGLQEGMRAMIEEIAYMDEEDLRDLGLDMAAPMAEAEVGTFEEHGVLTTNAGLVLRLGDGTEYQLTIVQSR